MVFNCFQRHDLFILFPSLVCLAISIVLYVNAKDGKLWPALLFLTLAAFGLRVFMAHLDPFLWDWDERYHALVAKNFLHHPFIPTLYDHPVLPFDYRIWTQNHIWMHKQPLPLWQIALSFYLFGVNQFTARFPMVIEGVLLTLIIYRIGTLTINKQAGYLSALIYVVSFYALDFMTGDQATDSVDFALVFYVSASLWAWVEYRQALNWKWLVLTGTFAGLAVLSKWMTGLLVFAAWGIYIIIDKEERRQIGSYIRMALAFLISVCIFLPWQLYAAIHYPREYRYEMHYNTRHLFHVLEHHSGTDWYYLSNLDQNFGIVVPYIILFAMIFMWGYIKRKDYKIFIFVCLLIPYIFFSFLVATKMPAYCYIACVPVFLALGNFALFTQNFIEKIKWRYAMYSKVYICLSLFVMSWFSINLPHIAKIHTDCDTSNSYRANKVRFTDFFRKIGRTVPKDYVIFGLPFDTQIKMMFYTGNTCYESVPDINEYQKFKQEGIKMAVFQSGKTPDYLLHDPDVLKIKWLQ